MAEGQAAPAPAAPQSADMRGVPDPVARVEAILRAEKEPAPAAAQPEQAPAQPEAQPEADAPTGPNKQVEGDEAPAEDARPVAEIPLDQLEAIELEVTVKGEDGKDVQEKVSIKELKEGRMRQADYSRKTAEVARQREQLAQETRKAVETERANYVKELQTLHELVTHTAQAELANVNWNDLAANNPFEYVRLDNRKREINQALESIKAKQAEVITKHQAEQQAALREQAIKARAQLEKDIPGFNDVLYQSLLKSGIEKFGYKPEEVTAWVDPRAIKLLHKAHLYDQMQAEQKQPAPEKKVVVPPKVVKPGAVREVNPVQQREAAAMNQLKKTHSIADAAAVIRGRMR